MCLSDREVSSVIVCCALALFAHDSSSAQTIYNSESATPEFYRALVNMKDNGCGGGVVVGDYYVLTAAHCGPLKSVTLVATSTSIDVDKPCCHPCYEKGLYMSHDLALWPLSTSVPKANQWSLSDVLPSPQGGDFVTVAMLNGLPIRTKKIEIKEMSICSAQYSQTVGEEELCAGSPESNICDGASGGPLLMVTGDPPLPKYLAGIASDAENDACSKVYDLYTKIDLKWIKGVMDGKSEDWCGSCAPVIEDDKCASYLNSHSEP